MVPLAILDGLFGGSGIGWMGMFKDGQSGNQSQMVSLQGLYY